MHVFLEPGTDWPEELNKEHYQNDPPAYSPCALLVRKYVIDQIGNFDPTYRHGNDSDWFFRARDAGIAMAIIPEVLLHRRFHGSNLSYETRAVNQELLRVIRLSVRRKHQQPRA
jgi:GT2 family glycosyltransferase